MSDTIQRNKFVELSYRVTERTTGAVLSAVEFPVGYVHGVNDALSEQVQAELAGKKVGDSIDLPIDCDKLYGPRDESLVFVDDIKNVPEEFREVGISIMMENNKGESKSFTVTQIDDKTLTVDGNNPLCGREVVFTLEVLTVRDATDEEIDIGGAVGADPDIHEILK